MGPKLLMADICLEGQPCKEMPASLPPEVLSSDEVILEVMGRFLIMEKFLTW